MRPDGSYICSDTGLLIPVNRVAEVRAARRIAAAIKAGVTPAVALRAEPGGAPR